MNDYPNCHRCGSEDLIEHCDGCELAVCRDCSCYGIPGTERWSEPQEERRAGKAPDKRADQPEFVDRGDYGFEETESE